MLCWCWEGRGGGGRANGRVEGQSSEGGLMGLVWGLGAMWGQVSARGPWGAVEVLIREGYRGPGGGEPLEAVLFPLSALLGNQSGQPPFLPSPTLSPRGGGRGGCGWDSAVGLGHDRTMAGNTVRGAGSPAEPSWAKRACVGVCGSTVCAGVHECEQVSE